MEYKVRIPGGVKKDIEEIVEYYLEERPDYAKKIFELLFERIKSLKYFPNKGRIVPELLEYNINEYRITSYNVCYTKLLRSDLFICSVWLFVGFSLVINKSFGKRFVYSIYINGMLLYVTLIIYLIMYPIVTNTKLDQSALMVIIAMSLFFIIPFILLTIKKLTTAST